MNGALSGRRGPKAISSLPRGCGLDEPGQFFGAVSLGEVLEAFARSAPYQIALQYRFDALRHFIGGREEGLQQTWADDGSLYVNYELVDGRRYGLLNAKQTLLGRQLLNLSKLTGFETVPDDYERTLTDIVKAYPAPCKNTK